MSFKNKENLFEKKQQDVTQIDGLFSLVNSRGDTPANFG